MSAEDSTSQAPKRKPAPKGRIKGTSSALVAKEPSEILNPLNGDQSMSEPIDTRPPMRHKHPCKARSKQTGLPCRFPAIPGGTVCKFHGGRAPQVRASAMERLMKLQHPAVSTMRDLMRARAEYPSTAYAAARDVLDRTIGKAAEVVRQEHSGTITIVHELDD